MTKALALLIILMSAYSYSAYVEGQASKMCHTQIANIEKHRCQRDCDSLRNAVAKLKLNGGF